MERDTTLVLELSAKPFAKFCYVIVNTGLYTFTMCLQYTNLEWVQSLELMKTIIISNRYDLST